MPDDLARNDKLIAIKQQWARVGRLLTGTGADPACQRLPPGQTLVCDWPVLDLGAQPEIDARRFRLDIDGLCRRPLSLSLAEFMDLPQQDSVSDIHCVTQWSRYDNHWRGVVTAGLLAMVEPLARVSHVILHAHDGYTTNLTFEQFVSPGVMLVHAWEGRPIERRHGGPVRLIVPQLYLWKSVKWIRRIELAERDRPGFWEVRGYHNNGDPWREERYAGGREERYA